MYMQCVHGGFMESIAKGRQRPNADHAKPVGVHPIHPSWAPRDLYWSSVCCQNWALKRPIAQNFCTYCRTEAFLAWGRNVYKVKTSLCSSPPRSLPLGFVPNCYHCCPESLFGICLKFLRFSGPTGRHNLFRPETRQQLWPWYESVMHLRRWKH